MAVEVSTPWFYFSGYRRFGNERGCQGTLSGFEARGGHVPSITELRDSFETLNYSVCLFKMGLQLLGGTA